MRGICTRPSVLPFTPSICTKTPRSMTFDTLPGYTSQGIGALSSPDVCAGGCSGGGGGVTGCFPSALSLGSFIPGGVTPLRASLYSSARRLSESLGKARPGNGLALVGCSSWLPELDVPGSSLFVGVIVLMSGSRDGANAAGNLALFSSSAAGNAGSSS